MGKHTQGPWHRHGLHVHASYLDGNGKQRHYAVLNALQHDGLAAGEAEANARLSETAPELLEHLKDMVRRFEGCLITNGTEKEFAREATAHARAAIAKAEKGAAIE